MTTSTSNEELQRRVELLELENQRLRSHLKKLQDSEKFFKEVVNNSQDIIFRRSYSDGAFEYFNNATIDLLGYTPEEIQAMNQDHVFGTSPSR